MVLFLNAYSYMLLGNQEWLPIPSNFTP